MTTRRLFVRAASGALAAGLATALAAGCASRGQQPLGEYVDDAGTTTRVKTRLAEDDLIASFQLRVDTLAGVVRLSGSVRTADQSARAERIVREVYGVKDVRNEVLVRP